MNILHIITSFTTNTQSHRRLAFKNSPDTLDDLFNRPASEPHTRLSQTWKCPQWECSLHAGVCVFVCDSCTCVCLSTDPAGRRKQMLREWLGFTRDRSMKPKPQPAERLLLNSAHRNRKIIITATCRLCQPFIKRTHVVTHCLRMETVLNFFSCI